MLQQENVLLKRKKASNNTSEEDIAELIELFSQEKVSLKVSIRLTQPYQAIL